MPVHITDKELAQLRRLGNALIVIRADVDTALALLETLERRYNAGVSAPKGKTKGIKEDRKNAFKAKLRR